MSPNQDPELFLRPWRDPLQAHPAPAQRGALPPRPERNPHQHRPQLQRPPEHDFAAHSVTAPNPKRQRVGWATLDSLFADAANTWVVHYSCESFYERTSGTSPRITSIAVRNLGSAQTRSFSIHQMAELQKLSFDKIEQNYDALELEMLKAFFEHVGSYKGAKYLHWNMREGLCTRVR